MASYINASTASSTFTTSLSVTPPSGIINGDLLIAAIVINSETDNLTGPAGWTAVDSAPVVTATQECGVWYRYYTTGMATPAWTCAGNQKASATMVAYRGVHPSTPLIAGTRWTRSSSVYTTTATSLTTTTSNQELLAVYLTKTSSINSIDGPSDMTLRGGVIVGGGGGTASHIYAMQIPAPATTGNKIATYDINGGNGYGILLALNDFSGTSAVPWYRA